MSALPPKADMVHHALDVRFVPIADMRPDNSMASGRRLHSQHSVRHSARPVRGVLDFLKLSGELEWHFRVVIIDHRRSGVFADVEAFIERELAEGRSRCWVSRAPARSGTNVPVGCTLCSGQKVVGYVSIRFAKCSDPFAVPRSPATFTASRDGKSASRGPLENHPPLKKPCCHRGGRFQPISEYRGVRCRVRGPQYGRGHQATSGHRSRS